MGEMKRMQLKIETLQAQVLAQSAPQRQPQPQLQMQGPPPPQLQAHFQAQAVQLKLCHRCTCPCHKCTFPCHRCTSLCRRCPPISRPMEPRTSTCFIDTKVPPSVSLFRRKQREILCSHLEAL